MKTFVRNALGATAGSAAMLVILALPVTAQLTQIPHVLRGKDSKSNEGARELFEWAESSMSMSVDYMTAKTVSSKANKSLGAKAGKKPSCPKYLGETYVIDPQATLHYALVRSDHPDYGNGLFCARLEVADHDGWVGFAISEDGMMPGSDAIIGIPMEGTVQKYDLVGRAPMLMPDDQQTLMDTSLMQEDGTTIMEFTKILVEPNEIPYLDDTVNWFLHARGGETLGYHGPNRWAFKINLFGSCPENLNESHVIDPQATLHYAVVPSNPPASGNGLFCARLEVVDHDGWVGFAISEEGMMPGSDAIIGIPMEGSVEKYDLVGRAPMVMPADQQTLTDVSIMQEDGTTVMEFTKILAEPDEIPYLENMMNWFLHARGGPTLGYHGPNRFSFEMDLITPPLYSGKSGKMSKAM